MCLVFYCEVFATWHTRNQDVYEDRMAELAERESPCCSESSKKWPRSLSGLALTTSAEGLDVSGEDRKA
ncbi:hypothetical protein ACTXT7_002153 [Hymenolepis weldensis]